MLQSHWPLVACGQKIGVNNVRPSFISGATPALYFMSTGVIVVMTLNYAIVTILSWKIKP